MPNYLIKSHIKQAREYLAAGRRLEAIKHLRTFLKMDFATAKNTVESMKAGAHWV
jgi:hypothetical protein